MIPNVPINLTFTQSGPNIVLKWFAVTGAVSYQIYRRSDVLALYTTALNGSPITGLTFTDTNPSTSQPNYYTVTAVNVDGESLPSATLIVDLTPKAGLPRVDPNVDFFNTFIQQRGYNMRWERGQVCPCAISGKSVTDASDLDHALCKNKQYIYTFQANIVCALNRMTKNTNLNVEGTWEIGTFLISTRSENKVSFYDRLIFQDSVVPFSQALKKGPLNGTDELRFPATDIVLPIIDFDGIKYTYGTDFGLDSDGNIVWGGFSGSQPAVNTSYSVLYSTHPRILIVEYPHSVRGQLIQKAASVPQYEDFPLQTLGKLEFFID